MVTLRNLWSISGTVVLIAVCLMFTLSANAADYTIHVVEPPVNNYIILSDGMLPPVCKETKIIKLWACRGEYEPVSFVVSASKPLEGVRIEVGQLTGPGGQWTKETVDVRVVKEYYRKALYYGESWAPIPTLLVHDESFLAIEPDPTERNPLRMKNVVRGELRDSAELQPVRIDKRKQFWGTVHVPENAQPGTYSTNIRIIPQNSEASEISLKVEVYPFDLLEPMLEYSIYHPIYFTPIPYQFMYITEKQCLAELKNMFAHGVTNPNIFLGGIDIGPNRSLDFSLVDKLLDIRESVGMRPKTLYLVDHAVAMRPQPLTPEERQTTHRNVPAINAWAKKRGYEQVFYYGLDELSGEKLSGERDSFTAVHEAGGKVFATIEEREFYERVQDVLDLPIVLSRVDFYLADEGKKFGNVQEILRHFADIAKAGSFERLSQDLGFRRAIEAAHRLGNKIYVYMNPIGGSPLPDLQRRNEGLGLWRVGFDGTMTYTYTHIDEGHEDLEWEVQIPGHQRVSAAQVYRTSDGVLDTLHWEGYREGVDDVRYLTTLLSTLNKVQGRFPQEPLIAETYEWLAKVDIANGDLDVIRQEIARRIITFLDLGYKEVPPEKTLENIDLKQVQIVPLPEHWRFKIDLENKGVKEKWFDPAINDSQWSTIRTDQQTGWEKQGFAEQAVGYGWYRTILPLTKKDLAKKFKYLYFEAVDEDGWVYVNGHQVFEHSEETTGLAPSKIWQTPFSVPLADVKLSEKNELVVRVYNREAMGGIWKPVHLVLSDQALTSEHLHALFKMRHE